MKQNINSDYLLEVKGLKTHFFTDKGVVKAVDDINFSIKPGEIIGIVGESGCGKSMTALSIMKLLSHPGRVVGGEILFQGKDLAKLNESQMRNIRGNEISMIFQEPMTSLNPVFRVGNQIEEVIMLHENLSKNEITKKAVDMLKLVGIPRAEQVANDYPHQLSGGMRQRVMIAIALACSPKLLIADEPTTALDVTIQAQILSLINDLRDKLNTAVMLITHDLGVVAQMADHIIVMYSGKVIEDANTVDIFKNPKHPYTQGLLKSIPDMNEDKIRLQTIEGSVPNPLYLPEGCYFYPRCKYAVDKCTKIKPKLFEVEMNHGVACFNAERNVNL